LRTILETSRTIFWLWGYLYDHYFCHSEFPAHPIQILKSENFQCVFGDFIGFLCGSNSKIQTA